MQLIPFDDFWDIQVCKEALNIPEKTKMTIEDVEIFEVTGIKLYPQICFTCDCCKKRIIQSTMEN
ncbi:hypothetical protein KAH94_05770 [bacterium]|nr:hypothetical protein [bacterium]